MKRKAQCDYCHIQTPEIGAFDQDDSPISAILQRITAVEHQLQIIKSQAPPGSSERGAVNLESRRSSLVPAMQGYALNSHHGLFNPSANIKSSVINDNEEQPSLNTLGSLSLRRDLSHPDTPPFGVWWTYTVEETLLWPILNYHGSVNEVLDVLFDSSDEEESDDDINSDANAPQRLKARRNHNGIRNSLGLDDGDVVFDLIDSFLRNVHIRSPILDPPRLRNCAKNLVENGLDWGGETCQVVSFQLSCSLLFFISMSGIS